MTIESKLFHLGDILSVTTGYLVSPNGISGVYEILNHLTQDNLFTHQLPRVSKEVRPHLQASMVKQVPGFKDIDASHVTPENFKAWLDEQCEKYGEKFFLAPLPADIHERKDPFAELVEMVGEDKVMVIEV